MSGSNSKAAAAGSTAGPRGLVAGKEEKKKAGGGVLNRLKARRPAPHHAADDGIGAAVTEQELLALDTIRPEHVLRLTRVTESECGAGRALPSRRASGPGPLAALRGAGGAQLSRLGGHPATVTSSAGQATLPAAPPGRACVPHPHLDLVGKRLLLSLTVFSWVRPRRASPWPAPAEPSGWAVSPLSWTSSVGGPLA